MTAWDEFRKTLAIQSPREATIAEEVWRRCQGEVERLTEMHSDLCLDTFAKNRHLAKAWADKAVALARAEAADKERARIVELEAALDDAIETVSEWASYAPAWAKLKHNYAGDIARLKSYVPKAMVGNDAACT